jgi:C1A family cysteine protease
MLRLIKILFIIFSTLASSLYGLLNYHDRNILNRFMDWMDQHKIISNDESNLAHIFNNWISNDKYIEEHNSYNLSFALGHNAYSGMDSDEFSQYMGFITNKKVISTGLRGNSFDFLTFNNIYELDLPTSFDWRTKGVVNPIRDQGQCGSCWSFSGTSTLESAIAIKTGILYDLSEQQSVDCSTIKQGYSNLGCNGGMYDELWTFDTANGGITSEACYPYVSGTTGKTGFCQKTCKPVPDSIVKSQIVVTPYSDTSLMNALMINPVSIAIEADSKSFQLYKSGVYNDQIGCGTNLDHAVVLVGWNSSDGEDYYILRNSWGSWGEDGYMRIARGSSYGKLGMCGLLSEPYYPVV